MSCVLTDDQPVSVFDRRDKERGVWLLFLAFLFCGDTSNIKEDNFKDFENHKLKYTMKYGYFYKKIYSFQLIIELLVF
jgi:hypothetical protein